ncbi:MAG: hypothetical protein DRO23_07830 [Thermoprotei archaeon]|nr:MAG: hypothetical protein DRO23_07830 [Thermoprotei archaeon]
MKFTYALKLAITFALITILILLIIDKYVPEETLFTVNITCDINTFYLEIRTRTWMFLVTYLGLLVLFIYVRRKFRR